jgi:RNA polymerase sigma-70 factor (ECF subfamily)
MGVLVSQSLSLKVSEAVSDEELVRRALAGERWGREMLYRRHAGSLLAMTVRLLANHGEAEEVVQDTFVTAFEQLGTLREPAAVRGWLGQIAVNLVRRRFRRGRLMRFLGLDRGADDATLEALADPGISTDQRAELALVDRLLRGMKPALRLAWMLRRVDGLELGEVASLCDCSLATVKRRIAEADAIVDRHAAEPRNGSLKDSQEGSQRDSQEESEDAS